MMFTLNCPRCLRKHWIAPWITWVLCSCGYEFNQVEIISDTEEYIRPDRICRRFTELERGPDAATERSQERV